MELIKGAASLEAYRNNGLLCSIAEVEATSREDQVLKQCAKCGVLFTTKKKTHVCKECE